VSVLAAPVDARPPARPRTTIIPEIQGLRAIAVAAVVLYHLWPSRLSGGFIGVDVFFVVSGFLITAHLLREADRGKVAIVQFWARRIRRLLPASLFVLAAIAVATVAFVPLADWERIFRHITASTVYVENWFLAADAVDYWAQASAAPPTQHFWSLSVEEQFYLVWPVLFALFAVIAAKRGQRQFRRAATVALTVIVVAGFAFALWYSLTSPSIAYFSTFARAWEFAAGGLVALLLDRVPGREAVRAVSAWIGVALIAIAALLITSDLPFPGWAALLPVVGTALVLLGGTSSAPWSLGRVSSWRPVMLVGDLSYSIYLWHWPLIVLAPTAIGRELGTLDKFVILALTIVLAALTKRFVEDPVRRSRTLSSRRSTPTFIAALCATALLVGGSVAAPQAASGMIADQLRQANSYAASDAACVGAAAALDPGCAPVDGEAGLPDAEVVFQNFDPVIEECFSQDDNASLQVCTFGEQDDPTLRVALVGDSHAGALAPSLEHLADQRGWDLQVMLKPGCPWSDTTRYRSDGNATAVENCASWRDQVDAELAEQQVPFDVVVTTSYSIVGNLVQAGASASPYDESVAALQRTWTALEERSPGTRVVVVRDNPNWDASPVECLQLSSAAACTQSPEQAFSNADPQPAAAAGGAAALLDLTDVYCPEAVCRSVIGGVTVYRDAHHLSEAFAISLAPVLGERLDALLASP